MFESSIHKHFEFKSNLINSQESQPTSQKLQPVSTVAMNLPFEEDDEIKSCNEEKETYNPKDTLKKLANYIEFHSIRPFDIWEGRQSLPVMLFTDCLQKKMGYKFALEEINCLRQISEDYTLKKEHFTALDLWRKNTVSTYPSQLYSPYSQQWSFDFKQNQQSCTYQIHKTQQSGSMGSENIRKSSASKSRKRTTYDQINQNFLKNVYTNSQSRDSKLQALRQDMEMNALQKKWQFIVMAGEMNKWLAINHQDQDHHPQTAFKIVSNESNFTIIKNQAEIEEVVPEVVFIKRYKAMKKKYHNQPTLDNKQVNKTLAGLTESTNSKGQSCRTSQRDKQLNEALLHIMRVRNTLEHQFKILSEAAINT